MVIFSFELVVKLSGLGWKGYLEDNWNLLDAAVVLMSWVEITTGASENNVQSSGFSVIRGFRLLRIFKLLKTSQDL